MRRRLRRRLRRLLVVALTLLTVTSTAYLIRKAYRETHPYVLKPRPRPEATTGAPAWPPP